MIETNLAQTLSAAGDSGLAYDTNITAELEVRIQIMCNLSEIIEAIGFEKGIAKGITKERLSAIERMIKANATKEQILSYWISRS